MAYNLVCTDPLHGHAKGHVVTDQAAIERLLSTHSHHFVKVWVEDPKPEAPVPASEHEKPAE